MNTENTTTQNTTRPFGYWLRAADHLLARELETAFQAEGITRREGRLLRLLGGDVVSPELSERLQRHGGKKLRGLVERGWIAETDGTWTLTDEGRAVAARLDASVDGVRARVSSAVSDEDLATTLASLEAIARELGWNPDERMPRGAGRHGFGPGRRGFGPGHGFGPRLRPRSRLRSRRARVRPAARARLRPRRRRRARPRRRARLRARFRRRLRPRARGAQRLSTRSSHTNGRHPVREATIRVRRGGLYVGREQAPVRRRAPRHPSHRRRCGGSSGTSATPSGRAARGSG